MTYRTERDSMGEIKVPAERLWGAQTQRSFENFRIGDEKMPLPLIHNLALIKEAAARVNTRLGLVPGDIGRAVAEAAAEVGSGRWDAEFPLSVWQTGSGTQTNMNVNEVIAHRAVQIAPELAVHPNDHVNRGQSSNDVFPSALHMTAVLLTEQKLLPAVRNLADVFSRLAAEHKDLVKIGRTHLQDATPLTLGQEIGAWAAMLEANIRMIEQSLEELRGLALGGTAVGTGLNTPRGFGEACCEIISELSGSRFRAEANKFRALSSRDAVSFAHGAVEALAGNLFKIANDVRWLASGPRSGIGEISIPANEPGSSIMPGKVNPTQSEALTMAALRVMGNQTTIAVAASQGNFQLNVYLPLMAHCFVQSVTLLADGCDSFAKNCAEGIEPNRERIGENLDRSLMLVTALNTHIGYDKAARIAKTAHEEGSTLKEAAVKLGFLTADEYDNWVRPEDMVGPLA